MSVKYDIDVLQKHSNNLYWSADMTAHLFPILGLVIGGAVGYKMFHLMGGLAGGGIGGYAGMRFGDAKATEFRSQAQSSLCLAQIEANTRAANTNASE